MTMLNNIESIIQNHTAQSEVLYNKWAANFRNKKFEKIYWDRHPDMHKYFFEANPSFFYEYKDLFDLARYPMVMLRDGFLGVLNFFFEYKTPPVDFSSIVLIHKKFENLIPQKWIDNVALYEIIPTAVSDNNERLVLYANPSSELFWDKEVNEFFSQYHEQISSYKEIYCLFPSRLESLAKRSLGPEHYRKQLIKLGMNQFAGKISFFPNIEDFVEIIRRKNFSYLNLDSAKVFIADSFVDHRLFDLGGKSIAPIEKPKKECLDYNLSFNHKVRITAANLNDSVFKHCYFEYKTLNLSELSLFELADSTNMRDLYQQFFSN